MNRRTFLRIIAGAAIAAPLVAAGAATAKQNWRVRPDSTLERSCTLREPATSWPPTHPNCRCVLLTN